MLELDGSWDNPNYVKGDSQGSRNAENVFCLSLATGSELLNMTLRVVVADQWWPAQFGLERNLVTGRTKARNTTCHTNCSVAEEQWTGDYAAQVGYLEGSDPRLSDESFISRLLKWFRLSRRK